MTPKTRVFVLVLLVSLGLDQGTKWLAFRSLGREGPSVVSVVPGFFELQYAENRGAAFSTLQESGDGGRYFLIGGAVFGLGLIAEMARRLDRDQRALAASLGLIGGGALGNLVDRLVHGHVVDFIVWRAGSYRWPNFNFADAALVVGMAALVLAGFFSGRASAAPRAPTAA